MSVHPDGFQCKRCGACCRAYVPVTERDIMRWAIASREDILQRVSASDGFIRPVEEDGVARCPLLKCLPDGRTHVCRIYDLRPEACARFPASLQEAERIGCPGIAPAEDGDGPRAATDDVGPACSGTRAG